MKPKASTTKVTLKLHCLRKVIEDGDDDAAGAHTEGEGDVGGDPVELTEKADSDGGDVEAQYMSTKALRETDCEVSYDYTEKFCA